MLVSSFAHCDPAHESTYEQKDSPGELTMIAVVGAGKMGEALISGWLKAGIAPSEVLITERYVSRADELCRLYGVRAVSNAGAAEQAETLVLAVKPQDMAVLLDELAPILTAKTLVVTIAAGIPTAVIERRLADGVPVVRVMPNTPALVGEAMSAISAGAHATDVHLDRAEALLHESVNRHGAGAAPARRQGDPGARGPARRGHRAVG